MVLTVDITRARYSVLPERANMKRDSGGGKEIIAIKALFLQNMEIRGVTRTRPLKEEEIGYILGWSGLIMCAVPFTIPLRGGAERGKGTLPLYPGFIDIHICAQGCPVQQAANIKTDNLNFHPHDFVILEKRDRDRSLFQLHTPYTTRIRFPSSLPEDIDRSSRSIAGAPRELRVLGHGKPGRGSLGGRQPPPGPCFQHNRQRFIRSAPNSKLSEV